MIIESLIVAYPILKSYMIAPTFFQPWFLGTSLLALSGFILSYFVFHDPVNLLQYIGAVFCIIGSILLII